MQSPYFTPPRRSSAPSSAPDTPETPTKQHRNRVDRSGLGADAGLVRGAEPTLRRSKRLSDPKYGLPGTPESSPKRQRPSSAKPRRRANGETLSASRHRKKAQVHGGLVVGPDLTTSDDLALGRIVPAETEQEAGSSRLPKVILAQGLTGMTAHPADKLRHDPWRLLVMTTLLNKTAGRAVRPIFEILIKRYSTPQALSQASVPDLANLLFPLGLFNQRAASLIRLSSQYLTLGWPLSVAPDTAPLPDPDANGNTRFFLNSPLPELGDLDVNVFYGSGVYASDSFRIYSPLLPGEGGPRREAEWLRKRRRAEGRCTLAASKLGRTERDLDVPQGPVTETGEMEGSMGIKEVDDALSDEDDVGPEEWRRVRAGDKELRRYLRWRWAIEGIDYDYHRGPVIERERDKRRLAWLFND